MPHRVAASSWKLLDFATTRRTRRKRLGGASGRSWRRTPPAAWQRLRVALKTCRPEIGDGDPPDLDRSIALVSDALELLDVGAAPRPRESKAEARP